MALMPLSSYAAGLGKLNVSSGLGEPLKAEIELLSVTPEELSTLVATIASEEAYAAQGVSRLGIHNNIQVEVAKNAVGSPILRLRSSVPVSDPYLDMLIQVDWASGRLQREYTVLLDPPGYRQTLDNAAPISAAPPVIQQSGSSATQAPATETAAPAKKGKKSKKAVATPEETAATGDELTTQRGDTLSAIARQVQMEGISLDQMLVGLYEHNKSAFVGGNINRLKVGQIIRVPSQETLASISRKEASNTVKVHSDNWTAYRNNLAGVVAEAPASTDSEQKQVSTGKIGTAEDKAAAPKAGPQDVVKLSAGESAKAGAAAKEFEAKITALQEETTAREKALKEAQDRTASLEKQIQDMQKLLAMKNQAMADAQKNATAAATPATTVAPATPTATPAPEATPGAPATPTATEPTPASAEATPVAPVEAAPATTPAPAPEAAKPAPKKIVPPPAPEPEPESGLLESITNAIDITVLGAIGAVALLGGVWMFLRNKRRRDLDSFERGILTSGGLRANTVFGNTTGTASTSDTSFLTDFAQSADGSMIDTNDVDPIAEAEVYMAYGRDAQAEEILKDAISKEPKRYELHLKLLEMYANRKDTSAFEAIAGELYTTLGADDPTWAKVAEMGHAMEPENPLYDVSKVVAAASLATQKLDASDFANVPVATDADLDFSLDAEEPVKADDANSAIAQSFSSATNLDQDLSFDLGSLEPAAEASAAAAPEPVAKDNAMDFDLGDFNIGAEDTTSVSDDSLKTMENMPAFNVAQPAETNFANEISFEAPALSMPAPESEAVEAETSSFDMDFQLPEIADGSLSTPTINDISFDLDKTDTADTTLPALEADALSGNEITFDLPAVDNSQQEANPDNANAFDLSTISLDLGESSDVAAANTSDDLIVVGPEESPDVDIKLDLVAAYIDMNDKEGARELLEEVIKEGGLKQQQRAKDLLASLG